MRQTEKKSRRLNIFLLLVVGLVLQFSVAHAQIEVGQQVQAQQPVQQETAAPPEQELSLAELLFKGGIVMIPIGLLFIATTYVFIERYLYIKQATKRKPDFVSQIKASLIKGDIRVAKLYARQESSSYGRVINNGLSYIGKPFKEIESVMESTANIEVAKMEKNLGYLGIIAGVAPMLGFIGTIAGIIHIFYNISLVDNISIGIIAGGLYEKMVTSGTGLLVGMIAYISYHILNQRINNFILYTQQDGLDFIRAITNPSHED